MSAPPLTADALTPTAITPVTIVLSLARTDAWEAEGQHRTAGVHSRPAGAPHDSASERAAVAGVGRLNMVAGANDRPLIMRALAGGTTHALVMGLYTPWSRRGAAARTWLPVSPAFFSSCWLGSWNLVSLGGALQVWWMGLYVPQLVPDCCTRFLPSSDGVLGAPPAGRSPGVSGRPPPRGADMGRCLPDLASGVSGLKSPVMGL
mmetsp:Transcript_20381/g.51626  ORF Transcript_20381/g.51626 Transcript_20381/m.51626 type:complete len:205 (-) Transcript_20381:822-1436(-)